MGTPSDFRNSRKRWSGRRRRSFLLPATRAAQQATKTIPIVAVADDIVGAGLIDSLARPGGNTTGVSILATELDAKRLQLLRQMVPSARRVAIINDPTSSSARSEQLAEAARSRRASTCRCSQPSRLRSSVLFYSGQP